MTKIPNFTLSNGTKVPAVGLGTFSFTTDGAFDAVKKGLELGYRVHVPLPTLLRLC